MSSASADRQAAHAVALVILTASLMLGLALAQPAVDPLTALNARATAGAAPDYVEDRVCGNCHSALYDSFQAVGMAQAFKVPQRATRIERFGETYLHAASHRYYRIDRHDDGRLTFTRYQRDADDRPINRIDIDIDWVIGSGNRARSYLYQTEHGELFMLPVSWYSEQSQWRMSPGFESAQHQGVGRKITRACLFCHNAYPEVAAGSDVSWKPPRFPHTLPEGIGCQRCHGPGAAHVRSALSGQAIDATRAAIVNPANLPVEERDSVCFQCHLLPAESVEGVRIAERADYSFRPGQRLRDYIANVDVVTNEPEERFEINHHAYRFTQSACYIESAGALSCMSCHDPHRKPESTAFRRETADTCSGCHTQAAELHSAVGYRDDGCVDCHMPTRRTKDVVEVTMTDHRIATGPFDTAALTQHAARSPVRVDAVNVFAFANAGGSAPAEPYRHMAALRANRLVETSRRELQKHLAEFTYADPAPYVDLTKAWLTAGQLQQAEVSARSILETDTNLGVGYSLLGTALLGQGKATAAQAALTRSAELETDPETYFNLAAAQLARNDLDAAERAIDRALELRPLMAVAWKYRGLIRAANGDLSGAESALRRALEIDPADATVYAELIPLLQRQGKHRDAERFLDMGLRGSNAPQRLRALGLRR